MKQVAKLSKLGTILEKMEGEEERPPPNNASEMATQNIPKRLENIAAKMSDGVGSPAVTDRHSASA